MTSQGPRPGWLRLGWITLSAKAVFLSAIALGGLFSSRKADAVVHYTICSVTSSGTTDSYICDVTWWDDGPSRGDSGNHGPDGGGSEHTSANRSPTTNSNNRPSPKKSPCDGDQSKSADQVADPIILSSGAKVDTITDFALPGEMGLKFERYYNSRFQCLDSSCVGAGAWTTNFDYYLDPPYCEWDPDARRNICYAGLFIRPDGSRLYFRGGHSYSTPDTSSPTGTATLITNADGSYTLHDEDGRVLAYSSQGLLLTIKDTLGIGWTLSHPDSNTVVVTHTNGQSLRLVVINGSTAYGAAKQIQVTDPAGNVYLYDATTSAYDGVATPVSHLGTLNKVTLPGSPGTAISYVYYPDQPAPAGSTNSKYMQLKEVDYNGVAHDTTAYDSVGRATTSSLADGSERTSIAYASNATGLVATVTNPLNHVSTYQYDGAGNLVSVHGDAAGQNCPATNASMSYDANGFMTSSTDNNGTVTQYTYDVGGLLQQKVEAVGTSIQRTTDYVWDTAVGVNRLLSVTVEGWSKTVYTYNAQNRLAAVEVTNLSGTGTANQTLATIYAYTFYANGMVHTTTVTHPSPNNSNTDTYTYDSLGNLTAVADGLGHTTTYSNYDNLGEVGRVIGPNGDIHDYSYDARGRVHTKTIYPNGAAATWTYTYDGFGLVYTETAPDGHVTTWNRDGETRVTSIVRNDKDGASTEAFGYDANGDVTSHSVSRNGTTSLLEILRYDALGRLYQRQGMHGQLLTYGYDGNGNVLLVTDAVGHTVSNQYDALNRLTRTTSSGGASPPIPSTAPALSAPATSSNGSYSVSWGSVSGAASYIVQAQVNGGSWSTVQTSSSTSLTLTSQDSGTYSYRARACNSTGCGSWSSAVTVVVTYITGTIDGVSVDGAGNATLSGWACSSGMNQSVGVEVFAGGASGAGGTRVATATANLASEAAVATACHAGGTNYRFAVPLNTTVRQQYQGQPIYMYGDSPVGNGNLVLGQSGTFLMPAPPVSGAPTLTTPASNGTGNYTVSWSAIAGATSYTLQEQNNGGAWATVQTSANQSWTASGKVNGSYGYQVQACNSSNCGAWSAVATTTVVLPPASAPTVSLPVSSNNGSYTVSWNTVATATSYDLQEQVNGGSWTTIQSGSASSSAISGRGNGSYGYHTRACNSSGCSAWSATGGIVVTHPPASAPTVSVPTNSSTGGYTVSWTGVSTATSYTLQEQVNGGGWATIQSSSATSRAISGKTNGTYGYQVQACNVGGCSGWSAAGSISVLLIPATPTGLSATIYATFYSDTRPPKTVYELDASWAASSGASSYDFQYCLSGGTCTTTNTTATSIWINPVHGTGYTTNVRACNAAGCSAWSPVITPSVVNQ